MQPSYISPGATINRANQINLDVTRLPQSTNAKPGNIRSGPYMAKGGWWERDDTDPPFVIVVIGVFYLPTL